MEVSKHSRIASLDLIRGIAVLGLPTMNIIHFAMPSAAYLNPMAFSHDDFFNHFVFIFFNLFADQKFMGLFTLLFGAGLILLHNKNLELGKRPTLNYYSRLFFLFVLGVLHFWFIWWGDILMFYAIIGIFVYPLRNLSPKILIGFSILCFVVTLSVLYQPNINKDSLGKAHYLEIEEFYQANESQISTNKNLLLGTYTEAMIANRKLNADGPDPFEISSEEQNAIAMSLFGGLSMFIVFKMFTMIFMGMALYKLGFLQANLSSALYKKVALIGIISGLSITALSLACNYYNNWNMEAYFQFGLLINVLGSVPLTLAYAALIIIAFKKGFFRAVTNLLISVGKMALSNYLMQSVICIFIFYGFGLGLHASLSRLELIPIVIGIWIFQIVFSKVWLHFFAQGPIEWLWRSCSSFAPQSILKPKS